MTDILITILVIGALSSAWVLLYDSNRFVVRSHAVADRRIKKRCRAVLLTDLHNKSYGKENGKLLSAIRGQQPDFVLIAGDLLTANTKMPLEPVLGLLRELARDYPVYYAYGNHEQRMKTAVWIYGDMAARYEAGLKEAGIAPLVNSHIRLPEYGIALYGSEIDREYYKKFQIGEMEPDYLTGLLGKAPEDA